MVVETKLFVMNISSLEHTLVMKLGLKGTSTVKTPCFVNTSKIFKGGSLTNI